MSTKRLEDLIALVENEVLDARELHSAILKELKEATRGRNEDMRDALLELLLVDLDRGTSVDHLGLYSVEILGKANELLADLEGKLASVAEHKSENFLIVGRGVDLLEGGQDEHSRLTHTRLRLAKNVRTQVRARNALVLD